MANQPAPSRSDAAQYSAGINTGIGTGRLENVTDMQNALWLVRALSEAKSFSRALTTDEVLDLGRTITKGNNTRVVDSRRRTQFILTTVDDYLQQKGLINKTDINYFTHLNDILFFAFNYPRLAGKEKFIRFTPSVSGDYLNQDYTNAIDKYRHRFNTQSFVFTSGFSNNIPVSLTHQNNYGASLKLLYEHTDLLDRTFTNGVPLSEKKATVDGKQAGLNLFYQHAIYPNTRTAINFNASSEAGYQHLGSVKGFYGDVNLNIIVNYFISYRTRFTASLGGYYQKNGYIFYQYVELLPDAVQLVANAGIEISL